MFVNVGGWMGVMCFLYVLLFEYVLFFGIVLGFCGYLGCYWVEILDIIIFGIFY